MIRETAILGTGVIEVAGINLSELTLDKSVSFRLKSRQDISILSDNISPNKPSCVLLNDQRLSREYGAMIKIISMDGEFIIGKVMSNFVNGGINNSVDSFYTTAECITCSATKNCNQSKERQYNYLHLGVINSHLIEELVAQIISLETLLENTNLLTSLTTLLKDKDPNLTKLSSLLN